MNWEKFLEKIKDKNVRDLYWALASPSPINPSSNQTLFFPEKIQNQIVEQHEDYFLALDRDPLELKAFLENHLNNKRLGYIFEALLLYFFQSSPSIELLLANRQIIEEKETLGEVDFIIKYEEVVYHLEVSVKYYLNEVDGELYQNWVGSSGNDDLANKIDKVINRQIPIAHHPQIKSEIKKEFSSYLWLKGKFFSNTKLPSWQNKNAVYGCFMRYDQFLQTLDLAQDQVEYFHLQRPNWMADSVKPSDKLKITANELRNLISINKEQKKALHVGELKKNSMKTLFLITEEWSKNKI